MGYSRQGALYVRTAEDLAIFERAAADGRFFSYYLNGFTLCDWQLKMFHAKQREITIVGGYGSGKTVGVGAMAVILATILPDFRFMNVAKVAWQSNQMFNSIITNFEDSELWKRFIYKVVERPYPRIVIKYRVPAKGRQKAYVHTSSLEFMSTSEQGSKLLSWEGDWINIDESGTLTDEDLRELNKNLGSRMRGATTHGRARFGRFSQTTNSWDNLELWQRYDMAEVDPEHFLSMTIKTIDNPIIQQNPEQLEDYKRRIPEDEWGQRLDGERPQPRGKEFSPQVIEANTLDWLDTIMKKQLEKQQESHIICENCGMFIKMPTHHNFTLRCPECGTSLTEIMKERISDIASYRKKPKAGVWEWALPPDEMRHYLIIGDPGQGISPDRNAPVIIVWDITEFSSGGRAILRAFWWGSGEGRYRPFINKFIEWKTLYKCMEATFDNTGTQKGFDEIFSLTEEHFIIGYDLAAQEKARSLTTLKILMEKQRFGWPREIKGISYQLGGYVIPDKKIAQDIVSVLIITAGWLRRYYYYDPTFRSTLPQDEDSEILTRHHYPTSGRFVGRNRARE